ncbi:hypothetical protein [Luteimonas sp. MC1750]|uniref:hypothetical protein n=1 Tax=Luteimonas sp. MC1750 TaxID=2799326 RepID=UPI0018F0B411|nr:hypothetical protein [Luteimonas sp. MC1750]MBJ6983973.1 hypothetical protein [Luteimonas sp. MC1750]QQO06786.1 hypothetical protein JGR68_05005 [Luteimonas sp. MC1750]
MTTDDTEELIHLFYMNQQTELTNIETEGRNMRREGRAIHEENEARRRRRRRESLAQKDREEVQAANPEKYTSSAIEEAICDVICQNLLLQMVIDPSSSEFEKQAQQLESEIKHQDLFQVYVDNDFLKRLRAVGITRYDRHLAFRQMSASELQRARTLEEVLFNAISQALAMSQVAQKSDIGYGSRMRTLSAEVSADPAFNKRVNDQVDRLLADAGL